MPGALLPEDITGKLSSRAPSSRPRRCLWAALWVSGVLLAGLGCGSPPAAGSLEMVIRGQQMGADCTPEGRAALARDMAVWVELESESVGDGILSSCELVVAETLEVSGVCVIPAVNPATLRLVYALARPDGTPLFLALYLLEDLDLRNPAGLIRLDFGQGRSNRGFDEDSDGVDNLGELCAGDDPYLPPPTPTPQPSVSPEASATVQPLPTAEPGPTASASSSPRASPQ